MVETHKRKRKKYSNNRLFGYFIPWMNEIRYVDVFIARSRVFKSNALWMFFKGPSTRLLMQFWKNRQNSARRGYFATGLEQMCIGFVLYTVNHKKRDISFLTITLANLNRFL